MKRVKSLLLSSALLFLGVSALAGCGGDGKIHVKFWHTMGDDNEEVVNRIIEKFNEKYPDVKIDHTMQGDYSAVYNKLNSAIPAGTMPQMAFCYPDHVADYLADSNAVVNLDEYLNDPELKFTAEDGLEDDFVEMYWDEGKHYLQSGTYSVPFAKSTEVMFYNVDFFNKYNLTVPTTWTETWAVCRQILQLKKDNPNDGTLKAIEYPMGYDSDSNLFITLCEQMGIPYTTNDNITTEKDHVQFNNADAKAMAEEFVGYMKEGLFVTKGGMENGAYTSTYFTEGKCVMSIGSTGGTSYQTTSNFQQAIAPVPTVHGTDADRYISQGPSICFFKKGTEEQKKAAWNFYKFLVRTEFTAAYATRSGYEPVRKSAYQLESYKEYLNGGSLQAKVSKCTAQLNGRFYNSAVYSGSALAREAVGGIFANMFIRNQSADKAFADAYTTATRGMK